MAKAACSLCKGFCCRNGDDDAFLDDRTLAHVRLARLGMTEPATLDRSMRADVCNSYFCGGLGTFLKSRYPATPTVIIAGEGEKMRTSPVLMP